MRLVCVKYKHDYKSGLQRHPTATPNQIAHVSGITEDAPNLDSLQVGVRSLMRAHRSPSTVLRDAVTAVFNTGRGSKDVLVSPSPLDHVGDQEAPSI